MKSRALIPLLVILNIATLIYAYSQKVVANEQRELATQNAVMAAEQRAIAEENAAEAMRQQQIAVVNAEEARRQQQRAEEALERCK